MQELEWQAALEAKWNDPEKNLIPVLIGQAEVPNFLRGVTSKGQTGFQLRGLREVGRAAEEIARGLANGALRESRSESTRSSKRRSTSRPEQTDKELSFAAPLAFSYSLETAMDERRQRFEDIAEFAAQLES